MAAVYGGGPDDSEEMVKRVLVTGSSGFIGRHAVPELVRLGYEVHAVNRRPSPPATGVFAHEADLLDAGQTGDVVRHVKPTHLLHLAWYAEHGKFWTSPLNLDWVAASTGLFKAFVEHGGTRAVFAGTCAEYDWSGDGPLHETATLSNPRTLYGVCKNALRQVVQTYGQQAGTSVAWARVFFLYGRDEHPNRLIPSILRPLLAGQPAVVRSGAHVRDLLHVRDVAGGFVGLLDSDVTGTVNIASGDATTLGDVAREAARLIGREDLLTVERQAATPENPGRIVADAARLRREVGWAPRYDLRSGLRDVVESLRRPL
jgi:nucleoside-diphosphate-sugar epimerase